MGNLTQEQMILADSLAIFVGLIVYIFRAVFGVLLFVLVIKAIKYFNNKNKYNCATCIYKQRFNQQEIDRVTACYSDLNPARDDSLKDG